MTNDINTPIDMMRPAAKLPNLKDAANSKNQKDVKAAAQEFEAVYIAEMMQYVFADVNKGGLMHGGNSENIYRSLMIEQYSKSLAKTNQLGMTDAIQKQILKLQEGAK